MGILNISLQIPVAVCNCNEKARWSAALHPQSKCVIAAFQHGAHQRSPGEQPAQRGANRGAAIVQLLHFANDLRRIHNSDDDAAIFRNSPY